MSIYDFTRNSVRRRLDIRKAQREEAQRNAQQEAEDAAFRAEISKNAHARRAEKEAAEEAQRREEERRAAEAAWQAVEARRRQRMAKREARYCLYWYLYAFLTILPLLIATILVVVYDLGLLPIWILAPIGTACCAFSIFTFLDLAPWLDRETVNRFLAAFWTRFKAYMLTPYSETIH